MYRTNMMSTQISPMLSADCASLQTHAGGTLGALSTSQQGTSIQMSDKIVTHLDSSLYNTSYHDTFLLIIVSYIAPFFKCLYFYNCHD